jgi:hypothetical protein
MAEGRIVSKRISRSEKVASLSSDTVRMFYTWMIPYLDVEGRMDSNPLLMKADIAPLLPHVTEKSIRSILDELYASGLIILYQVNGNSFLQLTKFDENQPNLRKDREANSKIPAPTPETLRSCSGPTPDLVPPKLREVKGREEKDKFLDAVFLTAAEYDKLVKDHTLPIVTEAISILNNYLMAKGKKYKSHYHVMIQWPIEEAKKKSLEVKKGW